MDDLYDKLLTAIDTDDIETASNIIRSGIDLNVTCDELQGAPALFLAILKGNLSLVELMLKHGADANFQAEEPAASIYTEKPLDLAIQVSMLRDWEKYHPIVKLLKEFGATDEYGQIESDDEMESRKAEAHKWQSKKQ